MSVYVLNLTSNQLSFLSGKVVVPANGNTTVSDGLIPYLAQDSTFNSYLLATPPSVSVSDGVTVYNGQDGKNFLAQWLVSGPPQNSNDPIAFTLAGMGFSCTADANLNSASETPLLLLVNPANSGANARAMFFYAASEATQGIITIRVYTNPTISNNGTALPVSNNLVSTSAPSSVMQAYGSPTISANGTKRMSIVSIANGNTDLLNLAQTAILTPGNVMLLTVTANNLGLLSSALTHFYMQWVEV